MKADRKKIQRLFHETGKQARRRLKMMRRQFPNALRLFLSI